MLVKVVLSYMSIYDVYQLVKKIRKENEWSDIAH